MTDPSPSVEWIAGLALAVTLLGHIIRSAMKYATLEARVAAVERTLGIDSAARIHENAPDRIARIERALEEVARTSQRVEAFMIVGRERP